MKRLIERSISIQLFWSSTYYSTHVKETAASCCWEVLWKNLVTLPYIQLQITEHSNASLYCNLLWLHFQAELFCLQLSLLLINIAETLSETDLSLNFSEHSDVTLTVCHLLKSFNAFSVSCMNISDLVSYSTVFSASFSICSTRPIGFRCLAACMCPRIWA